MKVLGISGSMRQDGNTALLIKSILNYIDEHADCDEVQTEFISLCGKEIKPCLGCDKCKDEKWCVIKSDDWNMIAEKMMDSEVVIFGSPTYYYDVCGQAKNLIDRTYSLYHDRKLAGRSAIVVTVCADRGCDRTLETLEGFVNTHEFRYLGYVKGKGVSPGDVLKDEVAMNKTQVMGKKILKLLSSTTTGKERFK